MIGLLIQLAQLIVYKQGIAAVDTLLANLPDLDGQPTLSKMMRSVSRYYTGFRIAHAGGVFIAWRFMYHGVTIVPSWGDNPMAASTLEAAIEHAGIDMAVMAPVTLQEIAKSPPSLEKMKKLKFIFVAGGKSVGCHLCPRHTLFKANDQPFFQELYPSTPATSSRKRRS